VINKFNSTADEECILLASLKAGGVGLNLTSANRVFLCDCWWNEAIESQAIDRVHRFGQEKEVHVVRLLITPSIDDKMVALQKKKSAMVNGALGGKQEGKTALEDLEAIFADD